MLSHNFGAFLNMAMSHYTLNSGTYGTQHTANVLPFISKSSFAHITVMDTQLHTTVSVTLSNTYMFLIAYATFLDRIKVSPSILMKRLEMEC